MYGLHDRGRLVHGDLLLSDRSFGGLELCIEHGRELVAHDPLLPHQEGVQLLDEVRSSHGDTLRLRLDPAGELEKPCRASESQSVFP